MGDTGWVWGPGLAAAAPASCAARGGRTQLHWDENSKCGWVAKEQLLWERAEEFSHSEGASWGKIQAFSAALEGRKAGGGMGTAWALLFQTRQAGCLCCPPGTAWVMAPWHQGPGVTSVFVCLSHVQGGPGAELECEQSPWLALRGQGSGSACFSPAQWCPRIWGVSPPHPFLDGGRSTQVRGCWCTSRAGVGGSGP